MSTKPNIKSKILNVATFGYVNRKAKEIASQTNEAIEVSEKIEININELIKNLGGLDNIEEVSATLTTLKVDFKNKTIVNSSAIKELGAKGTIISDSKISIVFGNWAKKLAEDIIKLKKSRS